MSGILSDQRSEGKGGYELENVSNRCAVSLSKYVYIYTLYILLLKCDARSVSGWGLVRALCVPLCARIVSPCAPRFVSPCASPLCAPVPSDRVRAFLCASRPFGLACPALVGGKNKNSRMFFGDNSVSLKQIWTKLGRFFLRGFPQLVLEVLEGNDQKTN